MEDLNQIWNAGKTFQFTNPNRSVHEVLELQSFSWLVLETMEMQMADFQTYSVCTTNSWEHSWKCWSILVFRTR